MKNIDLVRFIFYTNENNMHLADLCLKYFIRHNSEVNVKASLVCNKIHDSVYKNYEDKIQYFSANVEYDIQGKQFSRTMKKALDNIEEEYIFFFCDDYFFVEDTKFNELDDLIDIIIKENIDYFGFDRIAGQEVYNWSRFASNYSIFPDDYFYKRCNKYRYVYSVQPCIWKKKSLQRLVNNYDFSLHDLDETKPFLVQEDYNCVAISNDLMTGIEDKYANGRHFVISYLEIIRHGVFWHHKNGFPGSPSFLPFQFIDDLIRKEDLLNNKKYDKLLFNIK